MADETFRERYARKQAEQEAAENELRGHLAAAGFDGPHKFEPGGGMFDGVLTRAPLVYAICIGSPDWVGCGAMVRLGDPEERDGGLPPVERGIRMHSAFHASSRS